MTKAIVYLLIFNLTFLLLGFKSIKAQNKGCEIKNVYVRYNRSSVNLVSTNFEASVKYMTSGKDYVLGIRLILPAISSYRYNGEFYDAEEYGFVDFVPNGSKSIGLIGGCFGGYPFKSAYEFDTRRALNIATGEQVLIADGQEAWQDTSAWKTFQETYGNVTNEDLCNCKITIDNLDYSGIENKIEEVISDRKRAKEFKELEEERKKQRELNNNEKENQKSKGDVTEFWDSKTEFDRQKKAKSSEEFWGESKTKKTADGFYNSEEVEFTVKEKNGKKGVSDKFGNILIPFKYSQVENYKNEMANVTQELTKEVIKNTDCSDFEILVYKSGVVDKNGKWLLVDKEVIEISEIKEQEGWYGPTIHMTKTYSNETSAERRARLERQARARERREEEGRRQKEIQRKKTIACKNQNQAKINTIINPYLSKGYKLQERL